MAFTIPEEVSPSLCWKRKRMPLPWGGRALLPLKAFCLVKHLVNLAISGLLGFYVTAWFLNIAYGNVTL